MNFIDINGTNIAYKIWGNGNKTIVIDTAIGTCNAEWWHIAEKLSVNFKVLTFDRAGYGKSKISKNERIPKNIANELNDLLVSLNIIENIIMLGHSQGGFYAIQYALMYPSKVIGMILLDPATPYDDEFIKTLSGKEYKQSGVDKSSGMKSALWVTSLKLGFIIKPLLKKMPPFYYHQFTEDSEKYLLEALCKKNTYVTALAEYNFTHTESTVLDIKQAVENKSLNNLPIILITHSSKVYHKELQEFGNMELSTAEKIEGIWQSIMLRLLDLSNNTIHIIAEKSGHYIHLTDLDIVLKSFGTFLSH
jgi:pimeloyl-ACP methyl ester carboxylesterase